VDYSSIEDKGNTLDRNVHNHSHNVAASDPRRREALVTQHLRYRTSGITAKIRSAEVRGVCKVLARLPVDEWTQQTLAAGSCKHAKSRATSDSTRDLHPSITSDQCYILPL